MSMGSSSQNYNDAAGSNRSPWVARARAARTFGGLGGFLALTFLGAGVYLLQEAFSDPLRAQAVGLIAGAFILALATMLLYFLFSQRSRYRRVQSHRRVRSRAQRGRIEIAAPVKMPAVLATVLPAPVPTNENGESLPSPA